MKTQNYLTILIGFLIVSCKSPAVTEGASNSEGAEVSFPEKAKDMSIYEVNIRQYTPEGTFNAFAKHLPRIKEMGIDMVWLMPIHPIGIENRKGPLGSYYSVMDYQGINAEFGNAEDFKALLNKTHELDMYLIIDWVPNHTAWDHEWITSHPEYYEKNGEGEIVTPFDWTDVAQLNYDNYEMRNEMIQAMKYWVETFDIDGFRQDHAGRKIPIDFWQTAEEELEKEKNLFWLAEWNTPQMHFAFDATYAWAFHHLSGEIARGEKPASEIEAFFKKDRHDYGKYALRMTFTSNHDENTWKGTVFERYGDGYQTMAILMATIDGIPLVYGGQEAMLDKRLKFFEKDTIDWSEIPLQSFYTTLLKLRKENEALWSGGFGGRSIKINVDNDENVYAFSRSKNGNNVVVMLNMSGQDQSFAIEPGYISGKQLEVFSGQSYDVNLNVTLGPWEYRVFTFNKAERS